MSSVAGRPRFRIREATPADPRWGRAVSYFRNEVYWSATEGGTTAYHLLLALDQATDRFLGGCVVCIAPMAFGPLADLTIACLKDVFVLKKYRRSRIGTALVASALGFAWHMGAQHVRGSLDYDNLPAIALFRSMGLALCPEEDPVAEMPQKRYLVVASRNLPAFRSSKAARARARRPSRVQ